MRALEAVTVPFRRIEGSGAQRSRRYPRKDVVFLYHFSPAIQLAIEPEHTSDSIMQRMIRLMERSGGINCESHRLRR